MKVNLFVKIFLVDIATFGVALLIKKSVIKRLLDREDHTHSKQLNNRYG